MTLEEKNTLKIKLREQQKHLYLLNEHLNVKQGEINRLKSDIEKQESMINETNQEIIKYDLIERISKELNDVEIQKIDQIIMRGTPSQIEYKIVINKTQTEK